MTKVRRIGAARGLPGARRVIALSILPLLVASTAWAQEPAKPRWVPTVVVSAEYGDHDGGDGTSQAVSLYLAKPDRYWVFSAGHRRLFSEEGVGASVGYNRTWQRKYRLGAGISSGINDRGGLFPRYQVGVSAGMNVTEPLILFADYTHRQSNEDERRGDRVGAGFTWYAPGPWIVGGRGAYGVNQPGSRSTWSGGGSLTYSVWERWSAGIRVDYGDGSYLALPSHQVVEFQSWSYAASVSKFVAPGTSVRATVGHSDYYGGYTLGFSVSKRW